MNTSSVEPATTSPVIDFATAGRAFDHTTRKPPRARGSDWHPDATLITKCMEFAVHIQAGSAVYLVDPTDGEFAAATDVRHRNIAARALRLIRQTPSRTLDGLKAKSRLVPLILAHDGLALEEAEGEYMIALAADYIRMHDTLLDRNIATGVQQLEAP